MKLRFFKRMFAEKVNKMESGALDAGSLYPEFTVFNHKYRSAGRNRSLCRLHFT